MYDKRGWLFSLDEVRPLIERIARLEAALATAKASGKIEGLEMERRIFPPGEQPTIHTTDLCADLGCARCPGHLAAKDCGAEDLPEHTPIFCTHWCHRKRE